jgi:nucleotide-binding universal stress UspA family protein
MAGRIVVGVDGSDDSVTALRWAFEEAHLRDATVDVIHSWHYPYVGDHPLFVAYGVTHEVLEEAGQAVLDQSIAHAGPPPAGVELQPSLAQGGAATVLLEAATGADLLVVGSRGHGGFAGLLLGSVSQQCAHHAPCPVVIVPPTS